MQPKEKEKPVIFFGFNEAAEKLGLKEGGMKHALYVSKKLKGQIIGHSLVFTQADLDAFNATRKRGRPATPEAKYHNWRDKERPTRRSKRTE